MTLCGHCYAWRCHPEDRFCGHCGENLLQAEVTIEPVSTIYQSGNVPDQIQVVIRNLRGGLGNTRFFWRDKAGTYPEIIIADLSADELNQPNEQQTYSTPSADFQLSLAMPSQWELVHRIAPNKEYVRATLSCGLPLPRLAVEPSDFKIDESDEWQPLSMTLIHQSGGPAEIEQISVRADEAAKLSFPEVTGVDLPFTLFDGQSQSFNLPVTEDLLRVLQGLPQGLQILLEAKIKYAPNSIQLPLQLRVPIPARPAFKEPPEQVRALQGRRLRLPITLENQGGEACRVKQVHVDIRLGPKVVSSNDLETRVEGQELDAGSIQSKTLKVPLLDEQNQPLPARLYHCDVELVLIEEPLKNPKFTCQLEIRTAQPYNGIIAIDFGTTASAVAYQPLQGPLGQSSRPLPLSENDRFIPTAIAYYLDDDNQLQYSIGHEAIARLDSHSDSNLVYLDNLKWQLDNDEPVLLPDGSVRTWEQIAVDYLKRIKDIIENYTDIVAVVNEVAVTQPSRFHPLLMRALKRAYRRAELTPLSMAMGDKTHDALAESWPSIMTCLPLPLPALKKFQDETVGYSILGDKDKKLIGKHAVLTYDVGGGSTDMSLFLIEIQDFAHMQISELGTDGTGKDEYFFGNGFSTLLFRHLWPSCEEWLTRQGYQPEQFPVTLPWERQRLGAEQRIARENGRRCADFVLEHLQGDGGPFNHISLRLRNIGIWDTITDGELNQDLANLIDEIQEEFEFSLAQATLTLQSIHGTEVTIPAGNIKQGNGIYLDFAAFITDFIESCSWPMFERLQRLLSHTEVTNLTIYLITTGRGQFFPLVGTMLVAHSQRFHRQNKKQKIEQVRVDPDYAKTIVSQGACYLAQLPTMARGIRFIPRSLPSLGIQGDLDSETGLPQFLSLCTGLPTPADGWQQVRYPLPDGQQQVTITLYLSAHNNKVLSEDDKRLGQVSGSIDVPAGQGEQAHVMVLAKKDDCVEVYIGFSDTSGEFLEKHIIGSYEITPGACDNKN
jgi:hypothetical protein